MTIEINGWTVRNVPDDYASCSYMVARWSDWELWYYDSFKTAVDAAECAEAIGGQVLTIR